MRLLIGGMTGGVRMQIPLMKLLMVITVYFNRVFGNEGFGDLVVSFQDQALCATWFISGCRATLPATFVT